MYPKNGERTNDILEVVEVGRADNRRGNTFLREHPRNCDLCHADAAFLRYFFNPESR